MAKELRGIIRTCFERSVSSHLKYAFATVVGIGGETEGWMWIKDGKTWVHVLLGPNRKGYGEVTGDLGHPY